MKDASKILLYLLATVALAAAIAPPLFWMGRAVGAQFGIRVFVESDFPRYFNRAILIAAVALLWPLARSLRVGGFSSLGLQPDAKRGRHLTAGLAISLGVMFALVAFLLQRGLYKMRSDFALRQLVPILGSAAGASVVEELLFRGALLGLLRRTLQKYTALFFVSALYSIVHFVQPPQIEIAPETVNVFSGFALLPDVFWRFAQPIEVLYGFSTLFLLGWILGYSAIETRALWFSIGIHAGCIVGKFGAGKLTKRTGDAMPWFGKDLVTGIGPLLALGAMGLIVWAWLKYVDSPPPPNRD